MDETDEQLISRMALKDESALLELHGRYSRYLMAMARRILSDLDLAEQCVQDAFLSAWNASHRFDSSMASAKTWLVTIAHRRMLNARRDSAEATLPLDEWESTTESADLLEQQVVRRAVDTLGAEGRQLIEMAFYQGYSHSELAVLTGKPLGSVKTQLRSALSQLRKHFEQTPKGGAQ